MGRVFGFMDFSYRFAFGDMTFGYVCTWLGGQYFLKMSEVSLTIVVVKFRTLVSHLYCTSEERHCIFWTVSPYSGDSF